MMENQYVKPISICVMKNGENSGFPFKAGQAVILYHPKVSRQFFEPFLFAKP